MTGKVRTASITLGVLVLIAAVVFVFVTPYNRTPGVRLGGVQTPTPSDWSTVNDETLLQLKTGQIRAGQRPRDDSRRASGSCSSVGSLFLHRAVNRSLRT